MGYLNGLFLGQWDPIPTNPDVYKEKWFHGKISRDEVSGPFPSIDGIRMLVILG